MNWDRSFANEMNKEATSFLNKNLNKKTSRLDLRHTFEFRKLVLMAGTFFSSGY